MNTSIISRGAFGCVLSLAALIFATLTVPAAMASDATEVAPDSRQNAVVHWSTIADQAFAPSQGTNPMAQSRTLAILHASIHDALNAIDHRYTPYTPGLTAAPTASADAAVATAARDVLVSLLPDQTALVETAYDQAIATVPDGAAKNAGIVLGRAAAGATM